ncbi:MAG: hypothetical protein ACI9L9_002808 [Marivirga sp.]|jgi:hypothetical protein
MDCLTKIRIGINLFNLKQLIIMKMLMKMKYYFGAFMMGVLLLSSCDDSETESPALTISAVTATGVDIKTGEAVTIDLNGAASAADVPPMATFEITFDRALDAASVSASGFTLSSANSSATVSAVAAGSVVTLETSEELVRGTTYSLTVAATVTAEDGGVFTSVSRSFITAGRAPAVIPQEANMVVYVPFDGVVVDEAGHTVLNDDVSFAEDRFGNFGASGDFNGTTNFVGIEYAADMNNANTTVSYWMKLPTSAAYTEHIGSTATGVTQYVTFCIGGNNGTYHEFNRFTCCDLGFDIDVLKYVTNHLNSGNASTFAASFIEMKNEGNPGGEKVVEANNVEWLREQTGEWVHIVTSWDTSGRRKAFYINGVPSTVFELGASDEYALDDLVIDTEGIDADATNNKNLYLGTGVPFWATLEGGAVKPFRGGKAFAFKGQMDDFRMFSVALTDAEVKTLYDSEKP